MSQREHVYRNHSLKGTICDRCLEKFGSQDALTAHRRAAVRCELRDLEPVISEEQDKKLRVRPKKGCTEEEKWADMYRILFPNEDIPSPCTSPSFGHLRKVPKVENSLLLT